MSIRHRRGRLPGHCSFPVIQNQNSLLVLSTLQVKVSDLAELKMFRALSSSHRLNFNANQPQKSRISPPNRSQKQNASRPDKTTRSGAKKKIDYLHYCRYSD